MLLFSFLRKNIVTEYFFGFFIFLLKESFCMSIKEGVNGSIGSQFYSKKLIQILLQKMRIHYEQQKRLLKTLIHTETL
jgi:hypothetical protein